MKTYNPTEPPTLQLRTPAVLMAAILAAHLASAATNTWTGAAGDLNWSDGGNWSGGVPALNDNVVFNSNNAGTSAGIVNNIVDSTVSIQSLSYNNTNTYHTTQINPNTTLTITGSVATALFVGTGTDAGGTATAYATVLGSGSLLVTNSSGVINIRQGSTTGGAHKATLDLSGLSNFSAGVNHILVAGDGVSSTPSSQLRESALLNLAQTNFILCTASSATPGLTMGDGPGNASSATVALGQTNVIFSDGGITVGYRKSSATLNFGSYGANGSVLFRDHTGTGRQNQWYIGNNAVGSPGSTSATGTGMADFSLGTVDALVTSLCVGRSQQYAASGPAVTAAANGTLKFTSGTIDVNTVEIGYQVADYCPANGTVDVDNTAQLTVNNNLRLGNTVGTHGLPKGILNIGQIVPGGSVWVKGNVIEGGGNGDSINLTGGSLKVGGTLGSSALPLESMVLNNATLTFDLGSSPNPATPLWQISNLTATAPVTNNVLGSALSLGQFTLIKYTTLSGDDGSGFTLGSLPARVMGYLSNNTANSSIDLVITSVAAPKWNGNVNGNWDIAATANWVMIIGGTPTTYMEPSVPGDTVLFDDTATGTTTVNLATTLSPSGITVNNSSKDYTFSGSGGLSGPTRLNKNGSRTLTISNTGVNNFAGSVAINDGKVLLASSADRLPTNAAVTLADLATAALDFNNNNQTLSSLSGGGSSGGNVSLGTGTVNLTADGGLYNGMISGAGSVVKSGSGTQVLGGANLYGGGTLVTGGTLVVANTTGSGVGPGSIVVATNGTFQIGDGGPEGSIAVGTITNNGWVVLNRSDDLTFTTLIPGLGGLVKNNTNIVLISNPNSYTGQTTINAGALRISDAGALGTNLIYFSTDPTTRLELTNGITLQQPLTLLQKQSAAGGLPAIENLGGTNTIAGPITAAAGGSFWTFQSDADDLVIKGSFSPQTGLTGSRIVQLRGNAYGEWWSSISNAAGNAAILALYKNDAGTWTLWSTNGYTGNTVVYAGQLIVNGAILGSTNLSVNAGTLGGTGLITAPVTITAGGTLAPGPTIGSGTLTISNSLTLNGTTIMQVSHSGYDRIAGLTSLSPGWSTLQVVVNGALVGGEVFNLFDSAYYDGSDFGSYNLPPLPAPLSWDYSSMPVNGTLRVTGAMPQIGQITQRSDHNFQLSGVGPDGYTYSVLATTNVNLPLADWTTVGSGAFTSGAFTFTDFNATNCPQRFYRVVTP
jgi:autotransporter-associated beta strand protein